MIAKDGNLLVANSKNGNVLSYNVMFEMPDTNALKADEKESIIKFLSNRLSGWEEVNKKLFTATSSFILWPTRKIPLDKPWKNNRPLPITLIGDAAHIMPPFAGQGANIGLLDALILSENLTNGNFKTVESAITDYEQKMMAYAKEAQLETSRNEIEMHKPSFSFQRFYQ